MSRKELTLKVMSFNIRYGTANDGVHSWPFRRNAALSMLQNADCDLVGMQEVLEFQLAEITAALPHYRWIGVGREDGVSEGEFSAVLYDSRQIELVTWDYFWFSDTPSVVASTTWGNVCTRICTHASFMADGTVFDFYNLHIDHENSYSRSKSIELLCNQINSRPVALPVIVTGDFNDHEQSETIQAILATGFQDTFRTLHPDIDEQTTFHGWTDLILGDKIDYIFVKDGFVPIQAEILTDKPLGQFVSDHYPLVVELSIKPLMK